MKGDLYAQGKSPHELQEVIDYMGKTPPALFFFFGTAFPFKVHDCKTGP